MKPTIYEVWWIGIIWLYTWSASMLFNVINESCIICTSFCRNNRLILNTNEHTNIVDEIVISFFLSFSRFLFVYRAFSFPIPLPHATGSTSDFNKHGNFLIQWLSRHDPKYPVQRMSSKASLSSHVVALRCLTSLSWTFPLSLCLALQGKLPWLPPSSEACTLLFPGWWSSFIGRFR